jgi:hypothetical protein
MGVGGEHGHHFGVDHGGLIHYDGGAAVPLGAAVI